MANNKRIRQIFTNNNEHKWLEFPYEIVDVTQDVNNRLLADFTGERTGFVQVGPKKYFFPSGYKSNAEIYYNFEPRPDDVWIVTFPRSGTTWTQELIWLLANNLDYVTAMSRPLEERFPFLEFNTFVHPAVKAEFLAENKASDHKCNNVNAICAPAAVTLSEMSERRFIKTHLPFELLPPSLLHVGCKVVYVARNPKDVAVSFYHLNRLFRTQGFLRDFPTYWDYFENNLQPWTPYWSHIEEGWERRHNENLLFMFYEDMNKDLKGAVRKVADFLNKSYTEHEFSTLEEHLTIDNFRNNKSVNGEILKELGIIVQNEEGFVRKGKSGGWKDYFSGDLNDRADQWVEINKKRTNISFPSHS